MKEKIKGWLHHLEHACHCTYLGAVYIEGHGLYASVAGVLLVVVLLVSLVGKTGE